MEILGVIAHFKKRFQLEEDRKLSQAVERGGKTFRDQKACQAFLHLNGEGDALEQLCIDMVSILCLTQEPYCTTAEGVRAEADAFKAKYGSLFEGRVSMTYAMTYPDVMFLKSTKKEAARTKGFL